MRQIGSPSTSTRTMDSLGKSPVAATRCLVTLLNAGSQFQLHNITYLADRYAVQHLPEKPLDQHPLGDRMGNSSALEVEEVLGVHRTDGRPMAATQDVIVQNLEDRLGGCLRLL